MFNLKCPQKYIVCTCIHTFFLPVNGSWHASERKNTLLKSVSPVMHPALGIYLPQPMCQLVFGEMLWIIVGNTHKPFGRSNETGCFSSTGCEGGAPERGVWQRSQPLPQGWTSVTRVLTSQSPRSALGEGSSGSHAR